MRKKEVEKHSLFSDLFFRNLKRLSALRAKYSLSRITEEKVEEIDKALKVYPPHVEKITEELYLNNDDIIPIVQKAYFSNVKK